MPTDSPPKDPREYLPLLAGLDAPEDAKLDLIHRVCGFAEGVVERAFDAHGAIAILAGYQDVDSTGASTAVDWTETQAIQDTNTLVGPRPCGEDTTHDE